jgi:hypothetical protein
LLQEHNRSECPSSLSTTPRSKRTRTLLENLKKLLLKKFERRNKTWRINTGMQQPYYSSTQLRRQGQESRNCRIDRMQFYLASIYLKLGNLQRCCKPHQRSITCFLFQLNTSVVSVNWNAEVRVVEWPKVFSLLSNMPHSGVLTRAQKRKQALEEEPPAKLTRAKRRALEEGRPATKPERKGPKSRPRARRAANTQQVPAAPGVLEINPGGELNTEVQAREAPDAQNGMDRSVQAAFNTRDAEREEDDGAAEGIAEGQVL